MMKKIILTYLLLLSIFSLYAEKVTLKSSNSSEIVEVGEMLYLGYGSNVSEIMFMDKNPKISRIILEGTAYIKDYSFIAQCSELESIVINDVSLEDIDFLLPCKKLRIIALDSVSLKKLSDLKDFVNLEYLALTNCNLTDCSKFLSHGNNLKYINLCHNKISKFPKIKSNDKTKYFVFGNKVSNFRSENYIFDADLSQKLPEEFVRYIR